MISKLDSIASLYGIPTKAVASTEVAPLSIASLIQGKVASATVLDTPAPNIFTLKFGGQSLDVQSQLPLQKGEQIQFQVLRTEPVLLLQKVDPGLLPAQIRQTLSLAGEVVDVKPLLQNLQSTFFTAPKSSPLSQLLQPQFGPGTSASPTLQVSSQILQSGLQQLGGQPLSGSALQQLISQGSYEATATVLASQGAESKLIRIGTETYPLYGPLKAEPGESQLLRLQSLQPTVNLLAVESGGGVNRNSPLLLQAPDQSLPALVRALQLPIFTGLDLLQNSQQQLLHTLASLKPAKLQEPGAGEILKSSLEQLGIRSESLVAKGRAQEAAGHLRTVLADITRIFQGQKEITVPAHRLLATLENSQVLQAHFQNGNNLLFPLPFSFLEQGYLSVEQDGGQGHAGGESANKDLSCTIHLKMEGLGNVRIRCVQNKEAVRVAFFLDSQEKVDFIASHGDELVEGVSSAPLLSLSFAKGVDSPGAALIQNILAAEQGIVSTSA